MKKISFIVPVYNNEKTIEKTLNSILNQNNKDIDFEIVVINDGSTDNSKNIIEKYKSNENIRIFNKENEGIATTRNFGVDHAEGEYIIFVDGDDYVEKSLLDDINDYIEKDVDLIKWSPIWVNTEGEKIKEADKNEIFECSGEQGFNYLFCRDVLMSAVWNYAIKKNIMERFPENKLHEDFAVMSLIILKAKTMAITGKVEYYYVQTGKSIMRGNEHEKQLKRCKDMIYIYDNYHKKLKELKIEKVTKENLMIFVTNSLLVTINDLDNENKKYFIKELKQRKIYKNIMPRNLKQIIKRFVLMIKY